MSLRETVNAFGRDVSEHFKRDGYCTFAPAEETEGFVDTSAELDGSRGIAFLCDKIRVDFDGIIRQMNYEDIRETEIIESFESDYADELLIKGRTTVRVSDFSVNKRFLKLLVDTLCLRYKQFPPEEREKCRRECRARSSARYAEMDEAAAVAARHVAERTAKRSRTRLASSAVTQSPRHSRPSNASPTAAEQRRERSAPTVSTTKAVHTDPIIRTEQTPQPIQSIQSINPQPVKPASSSPEPTAELHATPKELPPLDIDEPRFSVPENHVPLEITEEKIEWLSSPKAREDSNDISESDLENMDREETMSYLLSSINEINAPAEPRYSSYETESDDAASQAPVNSAAEETADFTADEPQAEYIPPVIAEISSVGSESETTRSRNEISAPAEEQTTSPFTPEPPSKDIYIKASRKIREICESGRLTREEIQTALKENLVSAAAQFAEIAGANEDIPRHIAPKIEELRAASENLSQYFALGEDIAERVMFFMMYQMLSYSDRIVEAPETKERLNYFFKRYGPSGIMLSMLDMRVQ